MGILTIEGDPELAIAPQEWKAMLEKAGAPRPWAVMDAPERFAAAITFRWPAPSTRVRTLHDRASEAIDELLRVLPKIIEDDERLIAALDNPPRELQRRMVIRMRASTARERDALQRLFTALPEPHWERSQPRTPPWHLDAARLYRLYRQHVDPKGGISADGPAVRFIALALKRMGSQKAEQHAAIAKALQRMRRIKTKRS